MVGSSRVSDLRSAHIYNQTDGGFFWTEAELSWTDGQVSPGKKRFILHRGGLSGTERLEIVEKFSVWTFVL